MLHFENITENIMRLKVPFENIYTAVFLVKTDDGMMLIDAAAGERDVNEVILPALLECTALDEIKYLLCTHLHGDHGGGIRFLLPHLKNAKVAAASRRAIELYGEENVQIIRDGDILMSLEVLHLPGHSADAVAVLDRRTMTLISGDAVQLYGITRYGCGVGMPDAYRNSLMRLYELPLAMIVASHEYYPLGSTASFDGVKRYIAEAINAFDRVSAFALSHKDIGDAVAIAAAFTEQARSGEPEMPSLQASTVRAIIEK